MSTSEASSSMKQLVEKVKKTKSRSSGSKKASKSSGSKRSSKSSEAVALSMVFPH